VSIESNKTLGRAFFESQDQSKGAPAAEYCAADYTAAIGGNPAMDRAGHDQFAKAFYAAFPDIHHHIEDTIAEEDRVAVHFSLHGTNSGDFFGIPATNKEVQITAIAILKVKDGRVNRLDANFDEAGLMRQLGVMPA
jgi:steroid delta-isomerase-like uncharacterized protein